VTFRALPAPPGANATGLAGRRPRFAPGLVAHHAPDLPASAAYRDLLAAVLAAIGPTVERPALLLTAAQPAAGTTTVLLNLAITAARQGGRVLALDANLRRPGVAGSVGVSERPGLRELLAGAASLEQVIQETGLPGLYALAAGGSTGPAVPPATRCEAGARNYGWLLDSLRTHAFDLILVDGPRWDGRPDVIALGAACQAVLLVTRAAEVDAPAATELIRLIPEQGGRLAGCILLGS
jgi:Mrp family chromosome partitioning ATPase